MGKATAGRDQFAPQVLPPLGEFLHHLIMAAFPQIVRLMVRIAQPGCHRHELLDPGPCRRCSPWLPVSHPRPRGVQPGPGGGMAGFASSRVCLRPRRRSSGAVALVCLAGPRQDNSEGSSVLGARSGSYPGGPAPGRGPCIDATRRLCYLTVVDPIGGGHRGKPAGLSGWVHSLRPAAAGRTW